MNILVAAEYGEVVKYCGKNLSAKYEGKKSRVFLKVFCDDFTLQQAVDFAKVTPAVVSLVYQGTYSCGALRGLDGSCGVGVSVMLDVGLDVTDGDIGRMLTDIPAGVVPVICVPDDFCDLEFVYRMCGKYPGLRVYGGNLFRVPGVRLGCVDEGVLLGCGVQRGDMLVATKDGCEALVEVPFAGLELTATGGVSRGKGKGIPVEKKPKPRMFSGFLDGGKVAF